MIQLFGPQHALIPSKTAYSLPNCKGVNWNQTLRIWVRALCRYQKKDYFNLTQYLSKTVSSKSDRFTRPALTCSPDMCRSKKCAVRLLKYGYASKVSPLPNMRGSPWHLKSRIIRSRIWFLVEIRFGLTRTGTAKNLDIPSVYAQCCEVWDVPV